MHVLISLGKVSATVLLLALGAMADCNAPKDVKELQNCWKQLWDSNQLDSFMQLYAENATLLRSSGGRFVNRKDIKTYWEQVRNAANVKFEISLLPPVMVGDLGYDSGNYQENDTAKKDNTTGHEEGGYLVVAEKFKDKWLIVQQVFVVVKPQPVAPCVACFASATFGRLAHPFL